MSRLAQYLIIGYFLLFALAMLVIIPPLERQDEDGHLQYIDYIAENRELPNMNQPPSERPGMGLHAPLYYGLSTILTRQQTVERATIPNPEHVWFGGPSGVVPVHEEVIFYRNHDFNSFYVVRGFAVLLGVLTLLVVFRLAELFFEGTIYPLLAGVLVATLPQFAFVSSGISNDPLVTLLGSLTLYFAFAMLKAPERPRHYIGCGVALGLAVLAKSNALVLLPGVLAMLACLLLRRPGERQAIAARGALLLGLFLLVSGLFFVRNQARYGSPLTTEMEREVHTHLLDEKSLDDPYFRGEFWRHLGHSVVGTFGHFQFEMALQVYDFYAALALVMLLGIGLHFAIQQRIDPAVLFALLFVVLAVGGVLYYNLTFTQPQGRLLFPVLGLMAVLVTYGIRTYLELAAEFNPEARQVLLVLLVSVLVIIDGLAIVQLVDIYHG